ncbi:MAG: hypothetical protein P4M11_02350 [Candidatus Pacebacteria bacterium]|nr:hypothetical protein [Candidatus Paceibacterota bacterium]
MALTGDEFSEEDKGKLRSEAGFVAFYVKPLSKAAFSQIVSCL